MPTNNSTTRVEKKPEKKPKKTVFKQLLKIKIPSMYNFYEK
jgi:hypothetical protein